MNPEVKKLVPKSVNERLNLITEVAGETPRKTSYRTFLRRRRAREREREI